MNRHVNNGYTDFTNNYSKNHDIKALAARIFAKAALLEVSGLPMTILPMPHFYDELIREMKPLPFMPTGGWVPPSCEWQDLEDGDQSCDQRALVHMVWTEDNGARCDSLSCAGHSVQFAVELKEDGVKFDLISLGTGRGLR